MPPEKESGVPVQKHETPTPTLRQATTRRTTPATGRSAAASVGQIGAEFHTVLAAAIRSRGIGLSRIRARLQARGAPVSVATLSYWQSGRSRPERPESLQAVGHLEEVLELPSGALTSLLGPPRPRGRSAHNAKRQRRPETLFTDQAATLSLLEQVDLPGYRSLAKLSLHDQILIGADRVKRYQFVRQVVRADQDGIPGFPFLSQRTDGDRGGNKLSAISHCSIGNVYHDPEHQLMLAEILFDRPLHRGESTMVEFLVENGGAVGEVTFHERIATCPIREVLFDVRFAGTTPKTITRYEATDELETTRPLALRGSTVQVVNTDWGPGACGIRWQW